VSITAPQNQLTLDFEPGLADRHRNLRDCIASRIYHRGLTTVAIELNESPGNLSNQLGDESQRKFGIDDFELYMEKSKDYTAIYYLIDKFLHDKSQQKNAALAQAGPLIAQLLPLLRQAGMVP